MRGQVIILAAALLLAGPAPAVAHDDEHAEATGVVKERRDLMEGLGDRMKAVGAMFKGEKPFDSGRIAAIGRHIADKAPTIPELFPEDSLSPNSDARPALWKNWDDFVARSEKLAQEAGDLAEVAAGDGNQLTLLPAVKAVGDACKGCHEEYRKEDDDAEED